MLDMQRSGDPVALAQELFAAGVRLLQLRDKETRPRVTLSVAREIKRIAPKDAALIMNDRADLCLAAGFGGVHVGQDDLSPEAARRVCPQPLVVGVSTHSLGQVREADAGPADYIAFGPVFGTTSKATPRPRPAATRIRGGRGWPDIEDLLRA